jgi:hypothetical protein
LLTFRDANGKMVETILRECSWCNKVKEDVRDEKFERYGVCDDVCRDCSHERSEYTRRVQRAVCATSTNAEFST